MNKKLKTCPKCGNAPHWHTKKWYMAEWRINPERAKVTALECDNPYYKRGASMWLYAECEVAAALEAHPELRIKDRTAKQQAAAQQLAENNKELADIRADAKTAEDLLDHADWHYAYGLHRHTEKGLQIMEKEGLAMQKDVAHSLKKFKQRTGWKISDE